MKVMFKEPIKEDPRDSKASRRNRDKAITSKNLKVDEKSKNSSLQASMKYNIIEYIRTNFKLNSIDKENPSAPELFVTIVENALKKKSSVKNMSETDAHWEYIKKLDDYDKIYYQFSPSQLCDYWKSIKNLKNIYRILTLVFENATFIARKNLTLSALISFSHDFEKSNSKLKFTDFLETARKGSKASFLDRVAENFTAKTVNRQIRYPSATIMKFGGVNPHGPLDTKISKQ